jgi:endonuclease/exonuclease/phosphatase family metal-dependent hydrolase
VVTFNIEYGHHVDQAAREILRDPELMSADVVTVQEVSGEEAERLARQLSMNFVYYPATLRNDDEFGNAILSRLPISRDWKLVLPHEPLFGGGIRIAVGAELGSGDRRFVVYSIHNETFVMNPKARLDQVRRVLGDAEALGLPVVVAGDFNTMDRYSRVETARAFRALGYVDATRGSGTTAYPLGGLFTAELDHVFVRGFEPVLSGTRNTDSSDHRPLYAELRLPSEHQLAPDHHEDGGQELLHGPLRQAK